MAEIECQHKVRGTYMFIPNSRLYNLQTNGGRQVLSQLVEMGHEIALHFDLDETTRLNGSGLNEIEKEINRACQIMEEITGDSVRSVSFHRPTPSLLYGPLTIGKRTNAYAAELMVNYISDSRGQWQRPALEIPRERETVTQLLIHPIWWGTEHISPEDRLQEFFESESREQSPEAIADLDANLIFTVPGLRRRGESRP
jgi:peptidoglycan/xylan/chitin deacetylase (PgdA/CDA1 family)